MLGGVTPSEMLVRVVVLAVLLAVSFPFHEFAHALAAFRLGDSTARLFGRLTLNPIAHFDPTGGLMLAISVLFLGAGFGWAKPTPVNPRNLEGGRWGEALVAAAGPLSNLVLAAAAALPLRFIVASGIDAGIVGSILDLFVWVNLLLMVFNFLPIPPLDGSKVLYAFLDPQTAWRVRPVLEQYGTYILLILIALPMFGGPSPLGLIFSAILTPLYRLLTGL
jgi:Zn-dependent protease